MSRSRKFTREGFPKPDPKADYKADDIVWALIDSNMPYWPAQIKIGGTLFSVKKQPTTKGQTKVTIITFNDPSLTVILNEDDSANQKPKKRKKDSTKQRVVPRSKLLQWDAQKKDGVSIGYNDILNEYIKRKKLESVEDINDNIFKQWNDNALVAAEQELQRVHDLQELEKKRKLEWEDMEKTRQEEERKIESMAGQLYDGRKRNASTNKKEGWVLKAGDMIRYWASSNVSNDNILIATKIIKLHDLYGTLRAKGHVPIVVEIGGNPPFWETEIELLPSKDIMNPTFYPLNQCKLIPSEVENEMEKEHMRKHRKWDRDNAKKGWGGLLFDNNRNVNIGESDSDVDMEEDIKRNVNKRKRKRKRRLSDEDEDCKDVRNDMNKSDSDIQILSNTPNIVNGKDKITMTFNKSNKKKKSVEPCKKKRKLNNPKKKRMLEVIDESKNENENYINIVSSDSSDDDIPLKDIIDGNKIENMDEDEIVIPFPAPKEKKPRKPQPKRNNKKRKMKQSTLQCLPLVKGKEMKTKRKLRPNREGRDDENVNIDINTSPTPTPKPPKKREGVFVNYVNDYCCPQFGSSLMKLHDEFCPDKYCNDNIFMSSNGGFYNENNVPNNLDCIEMISSSSQSTFASQQTPSNSISDSCSPCLNYNDNSKKKTTNKKTNVKKKRQKMSDQLDEVIDTPKNKQNKNKKNKKGKMSKISPKSNGKKMSKRLDKIMDSKKKGNKKKNSNKNKKVRNEMDQFKDLGLEENNLADLEDLLAFQKTNTLD